MGKCNTWGVKAFFFRWIIVVRSHNKLVKIIDFRFPFPFPFHVFFFSFPVFPFFQGWKSKSQLQHWKFWKNVLKLSEDKNFYLIHPLFFIFWIFPSLCSLVFLIPFLLLIRGDSVTTTFGCVFEAKTVLPRAILIHPNNKSGRVRVISFNLRHQYRFYAVKSFHVTFL